MNNYIIKNENGEIITNSAERNIILLRYAAFLNENNDGNAGFQQMQMHQATLAAAAAAPQIQVAEHVIQSTQPKKSSKSSATQNAQGAQIASNQKLSGCVALVFTEIFFTTSCE